MQIASIQKSFAKAGLRLNQIIKRPVDWLFGERSEAEIGQYCYPPLVSGIPALPVAAILKHPDTEKKLADIQHLMERETRQRCRELIERYAAVVHLLPASEAHHHRGAGGLLAHGLEVGLYTLQRAYERLYGMEMEPKQRRIARPRWQLCCFVAGLCHDIGKPVALMRVTNAAGQIWEPFGRDLLAWCQETGSDRYYVNFKPHTQDDHEKLASLALDRVLTEEDRQYFSEHDNDMMLNLLKTVQNNPQAGHDMWKMVREADSKSVKEDLEKSNLAQDLGPQMGLPTMRIYLDTMRRLIGDDSWQINAPGGRLWVLNGGLYLVWPNGGKDIAEMLNQETAYQGVPRNPEILSQIMAEWRFIEVTRGGSKYWWIKPAVLPERLRAVKIREIGTLLEIVPASVAGSVEPADVNIGPVTESGDTGAALPVGSEDGFSDRAPEPAEIKDGENQPAAVETETANAPIVVQLDKKLAEFRRAMQIGSDQIAAMQHDLSEKIAELFGPGQGTVQETPPGAEPPTPISAGDPDQVPDWVGEIEAMLDDGVALTEEEALNMVPDQRQAYLTAHFKILPDGCLGRTTRE